MANRSKQTLSESSTFYGWLSWSVVSCFYLFQFILRVSPSVIGHELMRDFGIGAADLGTIAGLYYVGYSAMQIPLGIMLDLYGPRRMILSVALLHLLGAMIFAAAPNAWVAAIGRTLLGAGAAAGFLGSMKVASSWFRPALFAVLAGVESGIGVFGALLGSGPLGLLVNHLGWREALWVMIALGFAIYGLMFFALRDRPQEHHHRSNSSYRKVLGQWRIWMAAIVGMALYSPLTVLADLWGTPFISVLYGIPVAVAATAVSQIYLGFGIGSSVVGWITAWIRDLRWIFAAALSISALLLVAIIWIPNIPYWEIVGIFGLLGILSCAQVLVFPAACRYVPLSYAGTVTGLVNMGTMMGGTLLQPLVGYIMSAVWDGETKNGIPWYSVGDYQLGTSTLIILMLIALVAAFALKPPPKGKRRRLA